MILKYSIKTVDGYDIYFSPEDYEIIAKYRWYRRPSLYTSYAVTRLPGSRKQIAMHNLLLNPEKGFQVDHINHDGLDNRRENLRTVTISQNAMNRKKSRKSKTTPFKGVSYVKRENVWRSFIYKDGKQIYLGRFTNPVLAAQAYDEKAKELFGEFAYLNFPEGPMTCWGKA